MNKSGLNERTYLHPEEESARLRLNLQKINPVIALLNFLKLGDIWEQYQRLELILL